MVADCWGNIANGAPAWQTTWSGGNNQQWRLNSLDNGRYRIINHGAGAALEGAGSTAVGATTVLWTPNPCTKNEWAIAVA
jgi:alpha-L-fucosidase